MDTARFTFAQRLADNALVLGHRLSEWSGRAPTLEEDIALSNLALDLIGQARMLYEYAGRVEGKGRTEDDLAYLRDDSDYRNVLLVEQPNGDFAFTMVRHLIYAAFAHPFMQALMRSKDETLAAIAAKAEKELAYHVRHAAEWVIRLGDGTEESRTRAQDALDDLVTYADEMFETDAAARALIAAGVAPDPASVRAAFDATLEHVLAEATLMMPQRGFGQTGGRSGLHSEHLSRMLAEMQSLHRAHPGVTW
ncbi:MAG: 1,2-phenylacetyl-CoA epoxidase subunit PaaC [Beijerinckiaceae bacterium]